MKRVTLLVVALLSMSVVDSLPAQAAESIDHREPLVAAGLSLALPAAVGFSVMQFRLASSQTIGPEVYLSYSLCLGSGQMYAGDFTRGLIVSGLSTGLMFIAPALSIISAGVVRSVLGIQPDEPGRGFRDSSFWGVMGLLGAAVASTLLSSFDAYNTAVYRNNAQHVDESPSGGKACLSGSESEETQSTGFSISRGDPVDGLAFCRPSSFSIDLDQAIPE